MRAERTWIALAALLAGVAGWAGGASAGNRWGADYFPNVALTTHEGATVRLYDDLLKGKSVAINVIYTSCKDECPLETARMVQVQKLLGERMGKDIFFYSISIDPVRDTPEVLKNYASKFGVGPGWLFLTGKPEDIKLVTKKLGLSRNADSYSKDGHSASLMVGNEPTGQWMRNSAVDNPQFLAATMGTFLGWKNMPAQSYTEARPIEMSKGEYLYSSRCSACHSIGEGDRIGPDLSGVTARREGAWLARYIVAPDRVRAAGDPTAVALSAKYPSAQMPNLGLGPADVADVVSYIERRGSSNAKPAAEQAAHAHHHHEH
jgi:protein SCO1/2